MLQKLQYKIHMSVVIAWNKGTKSQLQLIFFFSDEMFTLCINYIGYTYLCINYIGYTYARVGIEVLLTQQRCCANFQVQIVVFSYTCLCAIILTLWILHYKTSTVFCFIFPGCCNIILVFETLATDIESIEKGFPKTKIVTWFTDR